jgi:hypothetical protein
MDVTFSQNNDRVSKFSTKPTWPPQISAPRRIGVFAEIDSSALLSVDRGTLQF